jgi:hypothetical protein
MAFLDNSSDIILDAVLTDEGRRRLAKGDGSFKIVKFALGDDEIDYSLYNGNNPSGSAYYDLDLLKTPVLEAFTNNIASMNSKLLSIPRTDLLFLPVIKANVYHKALLDTSILSGAYIVPVDADSNKFATSKTSGQKGVLSPGAGIYMRFDQGLDTNKISYSSVIPPDLMETEYNVIIDNRLGYLVDETGASLDYVSIDDDGYAMYNFAKDIDAVVSEVSNQTNTIGTDNQIIAGPRGTKLQFSILPSINLVDDYYFTLLGTTASVSGLFTDYPSSGVSTKIIKTSVRIEGVTTGCNLEVPVYFVKR